MMITAYKILARDKPVIMAVLTLLLLLGIAGCKKDAQPVPAQGPDNGSSIKYVLNDNFNFSVANVALSYAGLTDTLGKPGPYTFLAPDNDAFALVDVLDPASATSFQLYTRLQVQSMMRYSILPGLNSFKNLPLIQNKPIVTLTGGNVYVSKYTNGTDTVVTVNGVKLTSIDNAASNGLIQVLPQVMNPEIYHNAMDFIHSDTTLTLFSAALQRAKLDVSLLDGNDVYTILAPSNTAFQQSAKLGQNLGISTLDSILVADPAKLAAFLNYHIIQGRYFEGDLYRYAAANPAGISMLNNENVIIGGNPSGFHAITFLGNGDKGIASVIAPSASSAFNPTIYYANIPCGNGVIHKISRVLIP